MGVRYLVPRASPFAPLPQAGPILNVIIAANNGVLEFGWGALIYLLKHMVFFSVN